MADLKTLHVVCAMLFLGNFVVTGVWSLRAYGAKSSDVRTFAAREILFTDVVFTLVFGTFVTLTGFVLAQWEKIVPLQTVWIRTALEILVAAGVAWLCILLPLEIRMFARSKQGLAFHGSFVAWNITGWVLTLALFTIVYLMVVKPA